MMTSAIITSTTLGDTGRRFGQPSSRTRWFFKRGRDVMPSVSGGEA
jgi:hypothetical protein